MREPLKGESTAKESSTLKEIKESIRSPIGFLIFREPVTICDNGHNLEKDEADKLLKESKLLLESKPCAKCPNCRALFTKYSKNPILKNIIAAHLKDYPEEKAEQYGYGEETKSDSVATNLPDSSAPVTPSAVVATPVLPPSATTHVPAFSPAFLPAQVTGDQKELKLLLPTFVLITGSKKMVPATRLYGAMPASKVLLIGDEDAKKSQFLLRITNPDITPSFITTIGIDFKILFLENQKYQIWDTAGQERFRSITTSYYREASFIFIFGINNFHNWIREIVSHFDMQQVRGFIPHYQNGEVELEEVKPADAPTPTSTNEKSHEETRLYGLSLVKKCSEQTPLVQTEQKAVNLAPRSSGCC